MQAVPTFAASNCLVYVTDQRIVATEFAGR